MSLPRLYDLTAELAAWMEIEDPTEEQEAMGAIISGQIEEKAESMVKAMKWAEARADEFAAEEKRLAVGKKAHKNKAERIKENLKAAMDAADIMKISAGTFKVSLSKSVGKLMIDDEEIIPMMFYKTIPEQYVVDEAAVKLAMKDGGVVPGAHIEAGFTLRIS